jgi:peptide/nickel transport system permease protein
LARQYVRYPAAVVGLIIILGMVVGSVYALVALPYSDLGLEWYTDSVTGKTYVPKAAMPAWSNILRSSPLLSTLILDSREADPLVSKSQRLNDDGTRTVTITFQFDYEYGQIPQETFLYFYSQYEAKRPFLFWTWTTPDGRVEDLVAMTDPGHLKIALSDFVFSGPSAAQRAIAAHPALADYPESEMALNYLFVDPDDPTHAVNTGGYELRLDAILFEENAEFDAELVMLGQVYGAGGTDGFRRDLIVPLVWGMPFALVFGLVAAFVSVFVALLLGAAAVWYGGGVDWFVQRLSDLNMVLPILAISVVFYAYYGLDIWMVLLIIVVFSSFGSPVKTFRSAFLQVKEAAYIESAKSYGASDARMVFRYMIPRIMPVLIPQLIYLIPAFVFLEATLGMFNIRMIYPTWGRIIYGALNYGLTYGSRFWVLQPLALVFLTGLAFAMVGFALDKILNPKLESA